MVDARLTSAGYRFEEISNWALPGHEARHNWLYWTGGEYAGVGCAAHSHLGGTRSWNVRTPQRYCELLARGPRPDGGQRDPRRGRAPVRGALARCCARGSACPRDAFDDVDALGDLVERDGDRVVLSVRGRLLANQVTLRLGEGAHAVDR